MIAIIASSDILLIKKSRPDSRHDISERPVFIELVE